MSQTISAVYENGTLILEEPLAVSEGSKVEIVVISKSVGKKKTPAELLAEIAALPMEGKGEKFSNRDHDRILYGKENEK
ncbi:MAG: antitoxin AF2212-like protein [Pyrinomonadaceae bacterium]